MDEPVVQIPSQPLCVHNGTEPFLHVQFGLQCLPLLPHGSQGTRTLSECFSLYVYACAKDCLCTHLSTHIHTISLTEPGKKYPGCRSFNMGQDWKEGMITALMSFQGWLPGYGVRSTSQEKLSGYLSFVWFVKKVGPGL